MLVPGNKLTAAQKEMVLSAFIYRWTKGNRQRKSVYHCPHCHMETITFDRIECRQFHPTIALQTDEDWLKEHAFHFVKDGSRLMENKSAEPAYLCNG